MQEYLAFAVYRCEVAGECTGSLDFSVRWFRAAPADGVKALLKSRAAHQYENDKGELVRWPLSQLITVQEFQKPESGDEVIGFVSSPSEISTMAESG